MFFRIKSTKTGHVLKLLESYRDCEGAPRHRTVVSLGTPIIEKSSFKRIAYLIEKHFYNDNDDLIYESELTNEDREYVSHIIHKIESEKRWIPVKSNPQNLDTELEAVNIKVNTVEHETNSELGTILVCKKAWDELKLDDILSKQGIGPNRIQSSMISVINRLVDPVAENKLVEWYHSTALGDIIDEPLKNASEDRFYRVSDDLEKKHKAIELQLRNRTKKLHSPNRTILLYDLTNTHFEGICANNPNAKRGKNKQKRNDCPQIVVGMIFDQSGFELGHQMFAGNQSDSKSLPEMIHLMKDSFDSLDDHKPLVVMDAGMSSKENLDQMRKESLHYLVNDRRPSRKKYESYFIDQSQFKLIQERKGKSPVYVKFIEEINYELNEDGTNGTEYKEKILLCVSKQRAEKENAIISSAEKKLISDLEVFQKKVHIQKSLVSQKDIDIKIGKLQARHSRVQRYYTITGVSKTRTFEWKLDLDKLATLKTLAGCYVLRTNSNTISKDEIWQTYIALTTAEKGFRTLKGNLGLRPNYHQNSHRVNGHVFITILAYILLRHITIQLEKENDFRSWESIRRILKTHAYSTVLLPDVVGNIHRIRKAGRPNESQKNIYSILGIEWNKLPKSNVVIKSKKL